MKIESVATLADWIDRQARDADVRRHRVKLATVAFILLLAASIVLVAIFARDSLAALLEYEGVALAGGLVGLAELVSRYRDQPLEAVSSWPGLGYVAINALASLGALILIFAFDWKFGASGDGVLLTQLLVASFGAMAIFRTSLFTVRAGGQDVGIGPSSLLSIILEACDRGVDRVRAKARAWEVARVMTDVSYELAQGPLAAVAIGLMQNLPDSNQAALGLELERLSKATGLTSESKSLLLGLAIADQVGPHVLEAATLTLGDKIKVAPPATSDDTSRTPPASVAALATAPDTEARVAALEGRRGGDEQSSSRAAGLPQTPQTP